MGCLLLELIQLRDPGSTLAGGRCLLFSCLPTLWPANWDLGMPCKGKWVTVSCLQALGAPGCQAPLFLAPQLREAANACSTQDHLPSLRGFWLGHVSCMAVVKLPVPLSQPLLCALTLCCSPLASHWGTSSPLSAVLGQWNCPSPGRSTFPFSPATPAWSMSTSGSAGAPSCLVWLFDVPGGIIQHLIPEQRAPMGMFP